MQLDQRSSRRHRVLMTCLAWALVLGSCSAQRVPQLVDTLGSSIDQTEVLFKPDIRRYAPIVVVASVLENVVVENNRPAARFPSVRLDLHLVRCKLENVLRGQVQGEELSFYYFADPGRIGPRYRRHFSADPGLRFIFFLNPENGVLRSIGDVGEYSLEVSTGKHPMFGEPPEFGRGIADILFTLGDGFDPKRFATKLSSYVMLADDWGSPLYNVELLRKLVKEPEPIRGTVCRALVEHYNGQYECLYAIRDDSTEPDSIRQSAGRQILQQVKWDKDLAKRLTDPAGLSFPRIGAPDSRRRILDELLLLLSSPDPEVRRGSCVALRRYYPENARDCASP